MRELATNSAEALQIERLDWKRFADQILEIERKSFPPSLRDSRRDLQRLIESATSVALGLTFETSPILVGYVAGDLLELFEDIPGIASDSHLGKGDTLYIESLAVSPPWRHQGFGTALTREFLVEASHNGFTRATAHVARGALTETAFSFHVIGTFDNWYGTGRTFDYVEFV